MTGTEHLMWIYQTGGRVRARPLLADGTAYFGSHDRNIYALDTASRELKWRFGTDGRIDSSPALAGDTIVFGCDDYSIYAVDALTGAERWYFTTMDRVTADPVVADGLVLVGSHDGTFYALDAASGEERWRVPTGSGISGGAAAADGMVLFTNKIGMLLALRVADGEVIHDIRRFEHPTAPAVAGSRVIFGERGGLRAIDIMTARDEWLSETHVAVKIPPLAADGLVFFGSGDYLFAVDAASGNRRWQHLLHWPLQRDLSTADGALYVFDESNRLTCLAMESGMKLWDLAMDCRSEYSSPAAEGKTMILGCGDSLLGVEFGGAPEAIPAGETAGPDEIASSRSDAPDGSPPTAAPEAAADRAVVIAAAETRSYSGIPEYSNAQATWHLYPLLVLGDIWYQFFWFYRNWKYMSLYGEKDYRPGLRVLGLLSPIIFSFIMGVFLAASMGDRRFFEVYFGGVIGLSIVTYILMYDQIKTIRDHARGAAVRSFSLFLVVTGFFSFRNLPYFIGQFWSGYFGEPDVATMLLLILIGIVSGLVSVFFLAKVQRSNNEIWIHHNPLARIRKRFTRGEWALMIIFGGLQLLGLIGVLAAAA